MADDDKKLPTNVIPFPSRDESGLRGLGQEVADSVNLEHLAKIFEQTSNTEEVTEALINVAVTGAILDQEFEILPEMNTFNFDPDSFHRIPSEVILRNLDEDYLALPHDIEQQFEDQMEEQYSTYDIFPDEGDMHGDKTSFRDWMEDVLLREEDYKADLSNLENVLYKNYSKGFVNYLMTDPKGQQKFSNMINDIGDKYPTYDLFNLNEYEYVDKDAWRWSQGDLRPSLDKSETVPDITGSKKFWPHKRQKDKEAYFEDIKRNVAPTELSKIYNDYTKTIPQPKRTTPEKVGDVAEATATEGLGRLLNQLADKKQDRGGPRQIEGPKESKPTLNRLLSALSLFKRGTPYGAAAHIMWPTPTAHDDDYDFQIPVDR
jgi:hypothetical protein